MLFMHVGELSLNFLLEGVVNVHWHFNDIPWSSGSAENLNVGLPSGFSATGYIVVYLNHCCRVDEIMHSMMVPCRTESTLLLASGVRTPAVPY